MTVITCFLLIQLFTKKQYNFPVFRKISSEHDLVNCRQKYNNNDYLTCVCDFIVARGGREGVVGGPLACLERKCVWMRRGTVPREKAERGGAEERGVVMFSLEEV